jgi:RNA polymerase primary sigma factor
MARSKVSKPAAKPRHKKATPPTSESSDVNSRPRRKTSWNEAVAGARPSPAPDNNGQDFNLPGGTLAVGGAGLASGQPGPEIAEKVKDLVRLAQEQGYLTYNDITEALPEAMITPEVLDEIYVKLRGLEVEIVDPAEVDRVKQAEPEEEDEKTRLDILDDPVRMYLKQMGQVPLLTREQEVEISKRIESADNEVKRIVQGFGFAGKEQIALAEKLISNPPKERFDRVVLDKKIEGREAHLRCLRRLVKTVRALDQQVDDQYALWQKETLPASREKLQARFKKLDRKLQKAFTRFYYKQKVIEEMALVAEKDRKSVV